MMILESLALLVGAYVLWRRTPQPSSGHGRAFAIFVVAVLAQAGLLLLASPLFSWMRAVDNPADRITATALATAAIQIGRALCLTGAVYAWLLVVKPRLVRSLYLRAFRC